MLHDVIAMLLAFTAGTATVPSSFSDAALDRVVRQVRFVDPRGAPSVTSRFDRSVLRQEVTVRAWRNESLVQPDYRIETRTAKGFGVPRGGNSGSPSFDPFTRAYRWE